MGGVFYKFSLILKSQKGYLMKSSGGRLEKEGGLVFLKDKGTKCMWNNLHRCGGTSRPCLQTYIPK